MQLLTLNHNSLKAQVIILLTLLFTLSCKIKKENNVSEDITYEIESDLLEPNTEASDNLDTSNDTQSDSLIINYYSIPLEDLLVKAKKDQKKIILFFGAKWCGPCKKYKNITFLEPDNHKYLSENYYIKYLDVDVEFDAIELKQKYNITSLPTLVFLSDTNKEIDRITGHLMGYSFLKKITSINDN